MSIRLKVTIAFLVYLCGNSVFFGSVMAQRDFWAGLVSGLIAQSVAVYILMAVKRTES